MLTKNFALVMRDGMEIFVNRWAPDSEEEIKGIVQLHHGLAEHSMRYDRLGSVLAENGYAKIFKTVTPSSNNLNNIHINTVEAFYGKNGEEFECIVYDFDGSTNLYVENVQDIYLEILLSDTVVLESVEINGTTIDASDITTVNESGFIHAYIKLPENCVPNTVFVQTAS